MDLPLKLLDRGDVDKSASSRMSVIWSMLSLLVACARSTVSVSLRVGTVARAKCLAMTLEGGVGAENRERRARARDGSERESMWSFAAEDPGQGVTVR
jgi:hypothetical protein